MTEIPDLDIEQFEPFFEALHGTPPFPWQARLARLLASGEAWPKVLDLPTGSGKTAALDIAIFQLALESGRPCRVAPLRVVYVVDRRTIVDQAYDRAQKIMRAIHDAKGGVLAAVRARLGRYGRSALPLQIACLRGGIARADQWVRSPDQPLIAVSTVDQVGSRLLFRGYGVSDAMKPVHAGLLGNDVLYLLDEVHLSQPFRETLAAINGRYQAWAEQFSGRPITVVEMSATPGRHCEDAWALGPDDLTHPLLSRRLMAPKPTQLVLADPSAFIDEVEKQVSPLVGPGGATVAVVVNRVATARDLHRRLSGALSAADVFLVTGRMRPLDRDALERRLFGRIRSGRQRDSGQRPVVVVATQCIEAGADFDFDALVTECASLDALRQRFGRLDRLGELEGQARGVVIARKDTLEDDPVYGSALGLTWTWLQRRARGLDFGIQGLAMPANVAERGLLTPKLHAPVLLAGHLDAWAQTSPMPTPDPDVSLWLHGPQRSVGDVQIVWRADLTAEILKLAHGENDPRSPAAREAALGLVEATPPASGEAMPVPFVAAKRWLEGVEETEVADVEGSREEEPGREGNNQRDNTARVALAWRGDNSEIIDSRGLRPGDTIVVPVAYGGIANGTWAPLADEPILDLAELAILQQRGRAQVRLHPGITEALFGPAATVPPVPQSLDVEDLDDRAAVLGWLATVNTSQLEGPAAHLAKFLAAEASARGLRVERVRQGVDSEAGEYFLLSARRRAASDENEISTEDDTASFTGVAIRLQEHLAGVAETASDFARRLGLPPHIESDLRLAARWHDVGKVDPRFQRLLHGGSQFKALVATEPLAKSAAPTNDRRAARRARERAAYPRGTRHEVMSLALMAACELELSPRAHDWELVQHLVASHHGRCRPFAPWAADATPVAVRWVLDGIVLDRSSAHELARLDSGVAQRYWRLVRRYGWWGLAWMEAILRLADHRRSEEERRLPAGGAL